MKQIYELLNIYIFSVPCVHVIILDGSITERTSQINVKQLSNIREMTTNQLLLLDIQLTIKMIMNSARFICLLRYLDLVLIF